MLLLTDEEAAAALGVGMSTFHAMRGEPFMPRPITLGPRLRRWSVTELQAAVASMPRQQEAAAEPLELAKARAKRAGTTKVA